MAKVHVYKKSDERRHETDGDGCWCEPTILNEGVDTEGNPARVFVHPSDEERRRTNMDGLEAFKAKWLPKIEAGYDARNLYEDALTTISALARSAQGLANIIEMLKMAINIHVNTGKCECGSPPFDNGNPCNICMFFLPLETAEKALAEFRKLEESK